MNKIKWNNTEYIKTEDCVNGSHYLTKDISRVNRMLYVADGKVYGKNDTHIGFLANDRVAGLGSLVKYTVQDFDGATVLYGMVTKVADDHFIVEAEGLNLWIDDDNVDTIKVL